VRGSFVVVSCFLCLSGCNFAVNMIPTEGEALNEVHENQEAKPSLEVPLDGLAL